MDDQRLEIRISGELLAAVDRARGELARAAWVKDALRRALGVLETAGVPRASGPPPRVVSAEVTFDQTYGKGFGSCPECAGDLAPADGRWVCGDCGFSR